MTMNLGRYGIWQRAADATIEGAKEVESLGFGTLWLGGSPPAELAEVEDIIGSTDHMIVATGIINMWRADAAVAASSFRRIEERYPGRLLLGVGIGHAESTREYRSPYDTMVAYLDELNGAGVPGDRMILAALGPRALRLAAERTVGTHPYFTTPRHTRTAREIIGSEAVIAPEQTVIVGNDDPRAGELAARFAERYLSLANYRNSLLREGWDAADLVDGGTESLIDEVVLRGNASAVLAGVNAHLQAGADHVCIQHIGPDSSAAYRALASAIGL